MGFWFLDDFPELEKYFDDIPPDMLNGDEQNAIRLIADCAISALVPENADPGTIGEFEMVQETRNIIDKILPSGGLSRKTFSAACEKVKAASVQPIILAIAFDLLVSMSPEIKIARLAPPPKMCARRASCPC